MYVPNCEPAFNLSFSDLCLELVGYRRIVKFGDLCLENCECLVTCVWRIVNV